MAQPGRIIVVAGPQSSGKTTLFNLMKGRHPGWPRVGEFNPYTVRGSGHRGGAFASRQLELEITRRDLEAVSALVPGTDCLVETGPFHLAYLERYCGLGTAEAYFPRYLQVYNRLNPFIIFIDTAPGASWLRRQPVYEARLDRNGVTDPAMQEAALGKYRRFMEEMYPLWKKYFSLFPFDKIAVANSHTDPSRFLRDAEKLLEAAAVI